MGGVLRYSMKILTLRWRFGLALALGMVALALLAGVEVISVNRQEWLGMDPRSAANNAAFNFGIFFPTLLFSSLLALLSLAVFWLGFRRLRRQEAIASLIERMALMPAALVLIADMMFLIQVAKLNTHP